MESLFKFILYQFVRKISTACRPRSRTSAISTFMFVNTLIQADDKKKPLVFGFNFQVESN